VANPGRAKRRNLQEKNPFRSSEKTFLHHKNKFGVEYSIRHVSRILKSSGMRYASPYQKDYRRPENSEEELKNLKTS